MGYRIVVAGATGNVGREMLNILDERGFPADEVAALATRRSMGTEVSFGDRTLKCRDIEGFDWTGWDIALFAMGEEAAKTHAPRAAAAGCSVIDTSPAWRHDPLVPLIVPEVNPDAIEGAKRRIIASPAGAAAQLAVALKPLHDRAQVKRVVVTAMISASSAGTAGMDELWNQTKAIYNPTAEVAPKAFPRQIAFNLIPQVGEFLDGGETQEEWALKAEIKKIIDTRIRVAATCLRVPVFAGLSQTVAVETEDFLDEDEARDLLRESPGLMVIDKHEDGGYVTPVECVGDFATFLSRIRQDGTVENGLTFWCVSDDLRKGAALNAVQIAELLGNRVLKKG